LKFIYPVNVNRLKNKIKKLSNKNLLRDSEFVVNYGGAYGYWKERVSKAWVSDTIYKHFEGIKIPEPIGVNEYLTHIHGDYMVLPPEDKRWNRHSIIQVDWGNYAIKSRDYC